MTVGIRERDIAGGQCRPEQFVFPSRFVPFAAWRESRHYRVVVARGGINLSLMSRHSEVWWLPAGTYNFKGLQVSGNSLQFVHPQKTGLVAPKVPYRDFHPSVRLSNGSTLLEQV